MTFHPDAFDRISRRIVRAVSIAILCLTLTLLLTLALASYKLAGMQSRLSPLVAQELRAALGRDVRLGDVHLRGLGAVVIDNVAVAKGATFADGAAFTTSRATAQVNLLSLLLHRGENPLRTISQVVLRQPVLEVARSAAGRWDFQDVLDHLQRQRTTAKLQTQFIVQGGKVEYADARGFGATPRPINQQLNRIDARLTPTDAGEYQFQVSAEDTTHRLGHVSLAGNYSGSAGVANIDINADRIVATEITRFLPQRLPITFTNGTAAFRLSALFRNLPSPSVAHKLPTTELTAEMDLTGVGLRLREMSAPVVATSGRLRLVHDPAHYPRGSRLELIDVRAKAGTLPITLDGEIADLDLLDLAHLNPWFNVKISAAMPDGTALHHLFPDTPWVQKYPDGRSGVADGARRGPP